jgi:NodT family efflux transporter outer membrane factor (OMF) lipoprotein
MHNSSCRSGILAAIRAEGRRSYRLETILLFVSAALIASGCALGPDYKTPEAPVETDWLEAEDTRISSQQPVDPEWWRTAFSDPVLDRLVETALQQNLTLRSAGLRVLQARQLLAIAIGNQYPQQQQATGSASKQREQGSTFEDYSLGLNLTWEADFWGRFSRQVESSSAQLDASIADYDGALVSLVSQVAQNYILIRTTQSRLDVARKSIEQQAESLRVSRAKFEAGEVSELDADQAETLLNNTRATVPALETSLQQFKNALAILLGKPPHDMNYLLGEQGAIPTAPAEISLGMPQDLIRQRPDIRSAERQLAAQSEQIGIAETDLYPAFAIGGSIGTNATDHGDLFNNDSKTWNLFGAFQWNILNYGRLKSNVRFQDALFQQLLVDYQDTVIQAQGDVENAIVAYLKSHEQLASYQVAADASMRSVDVSTAQYRNGLVDFNTVISTLNADAQQQDLLASTQGSVATNLVQVYLALGGGWQIRDNKDPVELLPADMKDEMRERTGAWKRVLE